MKKKLKFTISLALAILLTGILQMGIAIAGSSLAELKCDSPVLIVQPETSVPFSINITATGNLASLTENQTMVQIDTSYALSIGSGSSSIRSGQKKFSKGSIGPYSISAILTVSKDTPPGEYKIPIKSYIKDPTKGSPELVDVILDYVTVEVEDNTPPSVVFTAQPNSWTNGGTVNFAWLGSDNATAAEKIVYSWKLNDNPWSEYSTATTAAFDGLEDNLYTFYVKAKDESGKESAVITYNFGVDSTKPVVTAAADRSPNINGWYNSDVVVNFTATDNLSGVSSVDDPVTVRDEGANQQILGSAADVAGNVGSGSISISLDKTAPTIKAVVPSANPFGWYNTDVTVGFNAEDTLSGVDFVSGPVTLTDEGESQPVSGRAVDRAGNQATATTTVNIDKTSPTVTATAAAEPNSHGWYRSDVIFNVSATDSLSGLASVDTPVTVGSEGANQLVPAYATDKAGNVGAATATVNIDKTAPDVQVNGVTNNGVYTLNQAVRPSWTADDLLSGVESIVPSGSSLDTGSVGEKTFSVTATDNAGNANTVTITYNVVYNFGGILQPINPAGSSVFKLGSTVPVKFQLTDSDKVFVSTALAKIYYAKIKDNIVGTNVEAVSTSNATTGNLFRYDLTNNQYIFNLSTKSGFSPGTYQISIILDDGSPAKTVEIGLK